MKKNFFPPIANTIPFSLLQMFKGTNKPFEYLLFDLLKQTRILYASTKHTKELGGYNKQDNIVPTYVLLCSGYCKKASKGLTIL